MRILVCGGREFSNYSFLESVLKQYISPDLFIISGGARGADSMAEYFAKQYDIPISVYKADWSKHGKRAGHIRNQQMLDDGKPDCVIAMPGGTGTKDMIQRSKLSGVKTIVYV